MAIQCRKEALTVRKVLHTKETAKQEHFLISGGQAAELRLSDSDATGAPLAPPHTFSNAMHASWLVLRALRFLPARLRLATLCTNCESGRLIFWVTTAAVVLPEKAGGAPALSADSERCSCNCCNREETIGAAGASLLQLALACGGHTVAVAVAVALAAAAASADRTGSRYCWGHAAVATNCSSTTDSCRSDEISIVPLLLASAVSVTVMVVTAGVGRRRQPPPHQITGGTVAAQPQRVRLPAPLPRAAASLPLMHPIPRCSFRQSQFSMEVEFVAQMVVAIPRARPAECKNVNKHVYISGSRSEIARTGVTGSFCAPPPSPPPHRQSAQNYIYTCFWKCHKVFRVGLRSKVGSSLYLRPPLRILAAPATLKASMIRLLGSRARTSSLCPTWATADSLAARLSTVGTSSQVHNAQEAASDAAHPAAANWSEAAAVAGPAPSSASRQRPPYQVRSPNMEELESLSLSFMERLSGEAALPARATWETDAAGFATLDTTLPPPASGNAEAGDMDAVCSGSCGAQEVGTDPSAQQPKPLWQQAQERLARRLKKAKGGAAYWEPSRPGSGGGEADEVVQHAVGVARLPDGPTAGRPQRQQLSPEEAVAARARAEAAFAAWQAKHAPRLEGFRAAAAAVGLDAQEAVEALYRLGRTGRDALTLPSQEPGDTAAAAREAAPARGSADGGSAGAGAAAAAAAAAPAAVTRAEAALRSWKRALAEVGLPLELAALVRGAPWLLATSPATCARIAADLPALAELMGGLPALAALAREAPKVLVLTPLELSRRLMLLTTHCYR